MIRKSVFDAEAVKISYAQVEWGNRLRDEIGRLYNRRNTMPRIQRLTYLVCRPGAERMRKSVGIGKESHGEL
ncbi:hypothetical protein CW304_26345 [Bacillus sp. UFRGS-B20]|nr:hypothetical protein CW304_26345 [Bacillus sp. UFRGS-B20]